MWPMPNLIAAMLNIGGALCKSSVIAFLVPPHSLANAHYSSAMQQRCQYRIMQDLDAK